MAVELGTLQAWVALSIIENGGPEGLHWRLVDELEAWHAERGTRDGVRIAWRQAYTAFLIFCDGYSCEGAALRLGVTGRTVERDLATLEEVFEAVRVGGDRIVDGENVSQAT